MKRRRSCAAAGLLAVAVGSISANAAPITTPCPGALGSGVTRQFTLTTDPAPAVCELYGEGNFTDDPAVLETFITANGLVDLGIGSATPTGSGAFAGTWSFSANLYDTYSQIWLLLQAHTGNYSPDFAVFRLEPGETSGSWSLFNSSGQQQSDRPLIASALFGKPAALSVPEPATLALFALGLLGVGIARRRSM